MATLRAFNAKCTILEYLGHVEWYSPRRAQNLRNKNRIIRLNFFCIFRDENKSVHSRQTFQVVKRMHYGELAAEPNLFVYNAL